MDWDNFLNTCVVLIVAASIVAISTIIPYCWWKHQENMAARGYERVTVVGYEAPVWQKAE